MELPHQPCVAFHVRRLDRKPGDQRGRAAPRSLAYAVKFPKTGCLGEKQASRCSEVGWTGLGQTESEAPKGEASREVRGAGGELRREVSVGRKCEQRLSGFSSPLARELQTNAQPGPNRRNWDLLLWARTDHQHSSSSAGDSNVQPGTGTTGMDGSN